MGIYLLDRTNGRTITLKEAYSGPLASAEFVDENPIGEMAVMNTPVTFRNARVNYNGARLAASQAVALVKSGKQISTPSLPNEEGNSFTVDAGPVTPFITSCPGWNQLPGSAPVIAMAAGAVGVYRMDSDGFIWLSVGGSWFAVDNDPLTARISVPNGT